MLEREVLGHWRLGGGKYTKFPEAVRANTVAVTPWVLKHSLENQVASVWVHTGWEKAVSADRACCGIKVLQISSPCKGSSSTCELWKISTGSARTFCHCHLLADCASAAQGELPFTAVCVYRHTYMCTLFMFACALHPCTGTYRHTSHTCVHVFYTHEGRSLHGHFMSILYCIYHVPVLHVVSMHIIHTYSVHCSAHTSTCTYATFLHTYMFMYMCVCVCVYDIE